MNTSRDKALRRKALTCGASLIVLGAVAVLAPSLAMAQDAPAATADTTNVDEVVITGVRSSLRSAQAIKRDADTLVDAISASDLGVFPDKSVAEALQRVPGITVNRLAASDDTSHFSAEPSGVLIRGLSQVRNEFNGRDTFSANSSRGLGWADVSPELLGGVDVYKNQTAELIEGGIAGTVNLKTRVPFDSPGAALAIGLQVNYGDISETFTPEGSIVFSNRWDTPVGEFGLMGNLAYSNVETESQGVQYGRMMMFDDLYGPGRKYIPSSVALRNTEYERTRNGMALAAQWQDNSGKFLVTGQYNRSDFENVWQERGLISYPIDSFGKDVRFVYSPTNIPQWAPRPAAANPADFTFDNQGNFQTGVMTIEQVDTGWWGASDAEAAQIAVNQSGQNMLQPCYSWAGCTNSRKAPDLNAVTRYAQTENLTEDASINIKWRPTENLRFNFDLQSVHSEVDAYDIEIGTYSFADLQLDATGDRPKMTLLPATNINQSPGGLQNPNNWRYNHAMDHLEQDEGDELAIRLDGEYLFQSEWVDSLKVGVRFADRDQTVRYSTFNWANIANNWNMGNNQNIYWNIDNFAPNGAFNGYPQGLIDFREFGGGYFGPQTGAYPFFNMDILSKRGAGVLSFANLGVGQDQWAPICTRTGETDGCFRDIEVTDVSEETKAVYAMLKFGGPDARIAGFGISGNVGIRYVETQNESRGSVLFPTFSAGDLSCTTIPVPPPPLPAPPIPQTVGCYLSADDVAFASGGGSTGTVSVKHENWLPSFNLKIDINPEWVLRFAASRAMSRPDIGLLKNYTNVTYTLPPSGDPTDPRWITTGGVVTGVAPLYQADAYNPRLAPTTADQFDLSLEHYFADVGSFTLALFYKKFDNYVQYGSYTQDVTNNGVTRTVQMRGPLNGDGAELQGFEVAYQRFFDFLPAPWDGLGIQANYTYVDNQGISNANLKPASGGGSGATPQPGSSGTSLQVDGLEGLSENAYNLIGMYEKGPWAVRVAYNWRSEFLVTAVDCCIYLPMWQEDAGFLDASVRYRFGENLEFSIQGSNLLNTETVLKQQVTDSDVNGGTFKDGAWFQNDRRVVFGVRLKY